MDHEAFGVPTDAMVRGWEYGGGDLTRLFEDWYINVADLLAGERGNYRNPKEPK